MKYWSVIEQICNIPNAGAEKSRATLRDYILEHKDDILLELSIIQDACQSMVLMTYNMESDGFNAPLAYNAWEDLIAQGKSVTGRNAAAAPPAAPSVRTMCLRLFPNNAVLQQQQFSTTVAKAQLPYDKLMADGRERINTTITAYRACRMFNCYWVISVPNGAILEELVHM